VQTQSQMVTKNDIGLSPPNGTLMYSQDERNALKKSLPSYKIKQGRYNFIYIVRRTQHNVAKLELCN